MAQQIFNCSENNRYLKVEILDSLSPSYEIFDIPIRINKFRPISKQIISSTKKQNVYYCWDFFYDNE